MSKYSENQMDQWIYDLKLLHATDAELQDFQAKKLSIVKKVRIEGHVESCIECGERYELLLQTSRKGEPLWSRFLGQTKILGQEVLIHTHSFHSRRPSSRLATAGLIILVVGTIAAGSYFIQKQIGITGDDSQYAQSNPANQNAGRENASPNKEPDSSQPEDTNQQNPIAKTDPGTGMLSPPNAPSKEPSSAKPATAESNASKRSTSRDRRQSARNQTFLYDDTLNPLPAQMTLHQSKKALQIQMAESFRVKGAIEVAEKINAGELEVGVEENKGPGSSDFTLYKIKKGGKREVVFNKGVRYSSLAAACDQFVQLYLAER